jgi:hypothetical protein
VGNYKVPSQRQLKRIYIFENKEKPNDIANYYGNITGFKTISLVS